MPRSIFNAAPLFLALAFVGCSAPTDATTNTDDDALTSDIPLSEAEAGQTETTARSLDGFEITIRPAAFIIHKGGRARYDIWANGQCCDQANLQFTRPPAGVRQSSNPWLPLGMNTSVRLQAALDAPNQDMMQYVRASVFTNGQWQQAEAWVRIVVRP
jgi:hypothetical protein